MKEHVRGLRRSYQFNLTGLLSFEGAPPAAIEFKMFELQQAHRLFFHVNQLLRGAEVR